MSDSVPNHDTQRKRSTAIPRGNPLLAPDVSTAGAIPIDSTDSPSAIHRVHVNFPEHNRSKDLTNWQTAKEFKWSMAGSSWITEAQNFYVVGRDGSLVFFQIGYSNLGYTPSIHYLFVCRWPSTTCQLSARYFNPLKNINVFESQSISAMRMKMSSDYTTVHAKKSGIEHVHVMGDLGLIKLRFDEDPLGVQLNLRPECQPFQVSDGNIHFGQDMSDGFINMKFIPTAHATGWTQVGDGEKDPFEGHALVIHQFQGVRPHLSASRWNLAYFVGDTQRSGMTPSCLFMIQLKTPDSYDDATINYGAIHHKHDSLAVSVSNEIIHGESPIDEESGFPIPTLITYKWHGVTFSDKKFTAVCEATPKVQCARICLLDNVPYVLRKVVETFVARPFVYQWLDRAQIKLEIEGEEGECLEGWIFQELSLI